MQGNYLICNPIRFNSVFWRFCWVFGLWTLAKCVCAYAIFFLARINIAQTTTIWRFLYLSIPHRLICMITAFYLAEFFFARAYLKANRSIHSHTYTQTRSLVNCRRFIYLIFVKKNRNINFLKKKKSRFFSAIWRNRMFDRAIVCQERLSNGNEDYWREIRGRSN